MNYFVPNSPEEFRAEMERREMEQQDRSHAVESFLYGLDQEGLRALSILLQLSSQSKRTAVYFMGQADALLKDRFNVCAVHGVDHDAEAMDALSAAQGSTNPGDKPTSVQTDRIVEAMVDQASLEDEYGIRWDDALDKFVCKKCGYGYPSLEDRMLRPPDTCPGCMAREGQG